MTPEDLLSSLLTEAEGNWDFEGFSSESLEFFDDFPQNLTKSNEWWKGKKEKNTAYLKPEFEAFIRSIIQVISRFDRGIETNPNTCIGRPTSQNKGAAFPYRWGAIHSARADKRIDVQFFLNLTSMGLRVGVYSGWNAAGPKAWAARQRKIIGEQGPIFEQLKILEKAKYRLIKTSEQDHANKSAGTEYAPSTSLEMCNIISENKQIGILKILDIRSMTTQELKENILKGFVETRKIYQLLQPSSYSSYARDLV